MRFKKGQQVVCIKKGAWHTRIGHKPISKMPVPKFNEICEVEGYHTDGYLYLKGYNWLMHNRPIVRANFNEQNFEPLADISELTEILEHQPAEI